MIDKPNITTQPNSLEVSNHTSSCYVDIGTNGCLFVESTNKVGLISSAYRFDLTLDQWQQIRDYIDTQILTTEGKSDANTDRKGDLQARVMRDILEERDYQDRKWGADRNHANADWLMILGTAQAGQLSNRSSSACASTCDPSAETWEEVGEANKAALEYRFGLECEQEDKIKELRKELIQVAAVAIAFLECLDRNHK